MHPWLGFYGKTYKDVETQSEIGVEILYSIPGEALSLCGVENGKILTKIDGKTVKNENQLQDILIGYGTNKIATVTVLDLKTGEEEEKLVFLESRPERPGDVILSSVKEYSAFYPLFGMDVTPTSSDFKKEFLITRVVKGSVADNAGFSENDPIKIVKTKVIEDGQYFYAEVFGKKRKNGYLEATMAIAAPMDSTNFF